MADSIKEARRKIKARIKAREDAAAAEAAAAEAKANPKEPEKEISLIDRIRAAFSSEENVNRINSALAAVEGGIDDADKDDKRKK